MMTNAYLIYASGAEMVVLQTHLDFNSLQLLEAKPIVSHDKSWTLTMHRGMQYLSPQI